MFCYALIAFTKAKDVSGHQLADLDWNSYAFFVIYYFDGACHQYAHLIVCEDVAMQFALLNNHFL